MPRKSKTPWLKTVVDEEWLKENKKRIINEIKDDDLEGSSIFGVPYQNEVIDFFPELEGKDVGEGEWIIVTQPPMTEWTVPKFSIWFAVPSDPSLKHKKYPLHRKLVSIYSQQGELRLFPREYNVLTRKKLMIYMEFLKPRPENNGVADMTIHFLNPEPSLHSKLKEMVFYMRSRGIGIDQAYMMLIDKIRDPMFCHFEMHPAYVEMFTR